MDLEEAESLMPVFKPGGSEGKAEVSMVTAIALVNR